MTKRTKAPISQLLSQVITESGIPFLTLEKKTGVARASIMRFVCGKQSLRLDMADRLANYFGLELKAKRKR